MQPFELTANIVDIAQEMIYPATIYVQDGCVSRIERLQGTIESNDLPFVLPGFVDAHVHIESSMLVPSEFARMAVVHGTVATVSDPHEIANVCGLAGVEFMIDNGRQVPFKFHFGAPSCVPATSFETAGATLDVAEVEQLLQRDDIFYLTEMMNYPGVLHRDASVMAKLEAAKRLGKPIDGHAPGLRGSAMQDYVSCGISTDHECFTYEEALEKLQAGMKVIIREGSAARNFDALIPLLAQWPEQMMFCSDDKHPDSLLLGHIDRLCARAVAAGIPLFHVLKAACVNPVLHYRLPVGLLRVNDPADFIVVSNLTDFTVFATYVNGLLVAEGGHSHISRVAMAKPINRFAANPITAAQLSLPDNGLVQQVIVAEDGQLVTGAMAWRPKISACLQPSVEEDVLKIVVYNRYSNAAPAIAFIKNFGLTKGAIASTVAHDSHNVVAVGISDEDLSKAINALVETRGGLSATDGDNLHVLPLPVAGLMTQDDGYTVAQAYTDIDLFAKQQLGSTLQSPFMTLSFMALLVIPSLKLSDKGLFDGNKFEFVHQVS